MSGTLTYVFLSNCSLDINIKFTSQTSRISTKSPPGPVLGPSQPVAGMFESFPDTETIPQSPYSANRALLRDLTLPTVPNYDIPPSPPGSPIPSTDGKLKHFLELKKQGVHFNDKLSKSVALKNPSLMQKLMDFSSIDEAGQYATTLSEVLWNPAGFPELAYKEELSRSQQRVQKRRESTRGAVEFVPATRSVELIRNGSSGTSQKYAVERITAESRGLSSSPQVTKKRKTRIEV